MNQDYDDTDEMREPRHGVLIVGTGLAAVLAGSVWMNLLSGEHAVFERTAAAPAPVIEEVLHDTVGRPQFGFFHRPG